MALEDLDRELTWLLLQQTEIADTEKRMTTLCRLGVRALREDSRHHIKRSLHNLCFTPRAVILAVSDDAERFKVDVGEIDEHGGSTHNRVHQWFSKRTLQGIGLPRESLSDMVLKDVPDIKVDPKIA
eukprot:COSAG02_NODE_28588_length_586_cov_2.655031_2_plen_127_part_00